jgi:DNA-binding CsgD family transcriptional regulator
MTGRTTTERPAAPAYRPGALGNRLAALLDRLRDEGGAHLVTAEPGGGRTAFLDHAARSHDGTGPVLRVRHDPTDTHEPYAGLRALYRAAGAVTDSRAAEPTAALHRAGQAAGPQAAGWAGSATAPGVPGRAAAPHTAGRVSSPEPVGLAADLRTADPRTADLRAAESRTADLRAAESRTADPRTAADALLTVLHRAAGSRPLLLCVDDAHLWDAPSRAVLGEAAARLHTNSRPTPVADPHPGDPAGPGGRGSVVLLISVAGHRPVDRDFAGLPVLRLDPLTPDDAADLLEEATGTAVDLAVRDTLVAEAEGNPALLLALARRLTAAQLGGERPLPEPVADAETMSEALGAHLTGLPPERRTLELTVAAALHATGAPDADAAPVHRAVALLDPSPAQHLPDTLRATADGRLRPYSTLLLRALYTTAPAGLRRTVHDALARALPANDRLPVLLHRSWATAGPDPALAAALSAAASDPSADAPPALRRAAHLRAAALSPDRTLRAHSHTCAAEQALLAGRPAEAIRLLDAVRDSAPPVTVRGRAELLRGAALLHDGPVDDARASLLLAARLLAPSDPARATRATLAAADAAWAAGDAEGCVRILGEERATPPHEAPPPPPPLDARCPEQPGAVPVPAAVPHLHTARCESSPLRTPSPDTDAAARTAALTVPVAPAPLPRSRAGRSEGSVRSADGSVSGAGVGAAAGGDCAVPVCPVPLPRGGAGRSAGLAGGVRDTGGSASGADAEAGAVARGGPDGPVASASRAQAGAPRPDPLDDYRAGMRAVLEARFDLAAAPLRRVLALAADSDDPEHQLRSAAAALLLGDVAAARRAGARALAVARTLGSTALEPRALEYLAYAELRAGRHALARTHAEQGLREARRNGLRNIAAHHHAVLALTASIEGDPDPVQHAYGDGRHAGPAGEHGHGSTVEAHAAAALATARRHGLAQAAALAQWATARADLARGRPREAADRLGVLVRPGPRRGHFAMWLLAVPCYVEAAALAGQPDDAHETVEHFALWAACGADPHAPAQLLRCRALLAGTPDSADELYRQALDRHDDSPSDYERARTELLYGKWLRRRRRLREARTRLGAALIGFERCGARPWARQAAAELRANGAAADSRAAGALSRLTPQQLRIARQVADGATNREVALSLSVSTRTVDYHLRNVFAALGVRSRVELARMVEQEDWSAVRP